MVTYTVWPVAYLHEKGPLLVKGVVQCEKQEKNLVDGVKPKESKDGMNLHKGQTKPGTAVKIKCEEPTKEKTEEPKPGLEGKRRQHSHDQQ